VIGLLFSLVGYAVVAIIQLTILAVRVLVMVGAMLAGLIGDLVDSAQRSRARRPVPSPFCRSPIDGHLRWAVFARDGYRCRRCGSAYDLTIDHVFPVSRGGSNDVSNLQTLCRTCNCQKGVN
jgi:hypothetical protein